MENQMPKSPIIGTKSWEGVDWSWNSGNGTSAYEMASLGNKPLPKSPPNAKRAEREK